MDHFYLKPEFGEDWFDYQLLYSAMVQACPDNGHIIEIGSWKDKSSVYMAVEIINSGKNIKFDCIDTWNGSQNDRYHIEEAKKKNLYELFLQNIEPVKDIINPIRRTSEEANNLYQDESVDIIFIDADHSYEAVKKDIKIWLPKVKKGGILAGHDYPSGYHPGVKQAVDEIFITSQINLKDMCWIYHNI